MQIARSTIAAFALGAVIGAPIGAFAVDNTDHRTFDGTVVHVSETNVKISGTEGGKPQILSFDFLPRIGVASAKHKLHAGERVRVTFDQKGLGGRHLDSIQMLHGHTPAGAIMKM
ncbi:MAG: hypothetical protein NVS3B17_19420 [Vulcanimicrobiaceae bacterium]